ncbi:FMN-binding glutamate synthase family protein [Blastococcus brunescens]|uniref:FMN-binding glutamate synthase family protein n=1 Tax=Blastococcus brunescens TaxID=1564165 RepID=A0ABZ1AWH6_9ACTN|nr:FMN-binding glutamate synthase family protein [Blastococcus sp. BMG 8361]WRL61718.1 FMN-binding glutamate synthase family protein [Blastococcus sp. BMG 8361]
MSFGSLSGPAVEALNRGAALADCLQNTGRAGSRSTTGTAGSWCSRSVPPTSGAGTSSAASTSTGSRNESPAHRCGRWRSSSARGQAGPRRGAAGRQGLGGDRLGAGVPEGVDCVSPSRHAEFDDADGLLDWVELLAAETGLPVGIKAAVGDMPFWEELTDLMVGTGRGVDFVTIDGGEGGTGAAPLLFTDSVSLPFQLGFSRVYAEFARKGLHDRVVFVGGGKLGLPDNATVAFALGCDMVNVAREAMLAIGCIQAQKCHTDTCPVGVATQNTWLTRGLDPALKSVRAANYVRTLRRDLLRLAEACGVEHPGLIDADVVEILTGRTASRPLREVYDYEPGWGLPSAADRAEIARIMSAEAPEGGSAPPSPDAID